MNSTHSHLHMRISMSNMMRECSILYAHMLSECSVASKHLNNSRSRVVDGRHCAHAARDEVSPTRAPHRIAYLSRTSPHPREQQRRRRRRRRVRATNESRIGVRCNCAPRVGVTPGFGSRARSFGRETVDRCDRTRNVDADATDGSR
jgi:hypothetical protein